jgi:hypothetical protein
MEPGLHPVQQVPVRYPPVFRIRMFLGLPDPHPDPLATSTDPDADADADPSLFSENCSAD